MSPKIINLDEIEIEIPKTIIRRIRNTVRNAEVEVGGKLLGKTRYENGHVIITIQTYIDPGPGVDNSPTHTIPDAPYQEAMFRVIERFDPQIDLIGSWHSHHTNGLQHLSGGDIHNYVSSVNDNRYNQPFFLALLVTRTRKRSNLKFYLFKKGIKKFIELDKHQITTVPNIYTLEKQLRTFERTTRKELFFENHLEKNRPPRNQFPTRSSYPNCSLII